MLSPGLGFEVSSYGQKQFTVASKHFKLYSITAGLLYWRGQAFSYYFIGRNSRHVTYITSYFTELQMGSDRERKI